MNVPRNLPQVQQAVGGPSSFWALTGILGGSLGWYLFRNSQRAQLLQQLRENKGIQALQAYMNYTKTTLGSGSGWLKTDAGLRSKADELLPYAPEMVSGQPWHTTVEDAMATATASLPKIPAGPDSMVGNLIGQGLEAFQAATGIEVPTSVGQEVEGLGKGEEAGAMDSIWEAGSGLWESLMGSGEKPANTNPNIDWDQYLSGLQ